MVWIVLSNMALTSGPWMMSDKAFMRFARNSALLSVVAEMSVHTRSVICSLTLPRCAMGAYWFLLQTLIDNG